MKERCISWVALPILLVAICQGATVLASEVTDDIKYVPPETEKIDPNLPPFVPSNEWQPVLPGQSVPPGLHIRMNLETGEKFAKLSDDENHSADGKPKSWGEDGPRNSDAKALPAEQEPSSNPVEHQNEDGTHETLLLGSPGGASEHVDSATATYHRDRYVKHQKELLQNLMKPKNEAKLIKQAIDVVVATSSSAEEKKEALADLEDFVHQVDNANDFVNMGGVDSLLPLLEQLNGGASGQHNEIESASYGISATEEELELALAAAWVLGTASQNNRPVQNRMLQAGGLSTLQHVLQRLTSFDLSLKSSKPQNGPGATKRLEYPSAVGLKLQQKVVFALSALLRNFKKAQHTFSASGGVELLYSLLYSSGTLPIAEQKVEKLLLSVNKKVFGIVEDLVTDLVVNNFTATGADQTVNEKWISGSTGPKVSPAHINLDGDTDPASEAPQHAPEPALGEEAFTESLSNVLTQLTAKKWCDLYLQLLHPTFGTAEAKEVTYHSFSLAFRESIAKTLLFVTQQYHCFSSLGDVAAQDRLADLSQVLIRSESVARANGLDSSFEKEVGAMVQQLRILGNQASIGRQYSGSKSNLPHEGL